MVLAIVLKLNLFLESEAISPKWGSYKPLKIAEALVIHICYDNQCDGTSAKN